MILVNLEKKIPIKRNGIPNPSEYASNNVNAWPGDVAANVSMLPKIGPIHGVQPVANANPKRNDIG